jgi:hypothetical protein
MLEIFFNGKKKSLAKKIKFMKKAWNIPRKKKKDENSTF